MPEPTPVPDAAEVLDTTRREWKRAVDLAGLDTQPLLRDAEVAALLAHGNEHGVTIRPDRMLTPASPDASLSPAPGGRLSAEEEQEVNQWRDFDPMFWSAPDPSDVEALLKIIDRLSAPPAPLPDDEEPSDG